MLEASLAQNDQSCDTHDAQAAALCVKVLLSFAASCTAAAMGWSQLLANWIGDGHCTGGGSPCTLTKCLVLSHGGMWHWSAMCGSHGVVWKYCYTQCRRGTGCEIVQLDTLKGVSMGQCGGLNICHWHLDCHGLTKVDAKLRIERCGESFGS